MRDKLVSLLIPTRNRHEHILDCVWSFFHYSNTPWRLEMLLRADEDDLATIDVLQKAKNDRFEYKILIGDSPPAGYCDIHQLYNEMADVATGHFLWILNDDVRMERPMWDKVLDEYKGKTCVINTQSDFNTGNHFPLVSRSIIDVVGYFGLYGAIDVQMEKLVQGTSAQINDTRLGVLHKSGLPNYRHHPGVAGASRNGNSITADIEVEGREKLINYLKTHPNV